MIDLRSIAALSWATIEAGRMMVKRVAMISLVMG